jgi:UMP-CMP kinase
MRCHAFATRFVSRRNHINIMTPERSFRGGSLKAKDCSDPTPLKNGSGEDFAKIVEESLSIAGRPDLDCFGGLTFRDCAEKRKVIFVLGGPGAGKGTQSDLLLQNYPCVHLSAGQLLREEVQNKDSPHSAMIEDCLSAGRIVPVEISLSLLQEAMRKDSGKSTVFLVDGFPRNFDNLKGWVRCMEEVAVVVGVLFYRCPLDILENRILERGKVSGRSDDNVESLRRRFKTFEDETLPVIDTLRLLEECTTLNVYDIRSDKPVGDVWIETQRVMDSIVMEDVLTANAKLIKAIASNDTESYQHLCVDEMFGDRDPSVVLATQEAGLGSVDTRIAGAKVKFISGTKAVVTYDVFSEKGSFAESRVWTYGNSGWNMLHYSRSPLAESVLSE